ncbi:hypothetical protein CR513_44434, partial [Mucuna pruriens]
MEAFLETLDLWEAIEEDYDVLLLPDNLTIAQIKRQRKKNKKGKGKDICVCFTHVPQVKHDKLDKKTIPSIFMGYNLVSKAYKVYHPQNGKMTITKDVYFNEDQQWD